MPPVSPIVPSEVTPLRASTPKVQPRAYHPLNWDSVKKSSQKSSQAKNQSQANNRIVARNKKATHEYDILETFECGIVLHGSEVKSLRNSQVSLVDSYARIRSGEIWLVGMHIAPYTQAGAYGAHDSVRDRKLLLHRKQIDHISGELAEKSLTLVPLSIYFKDGKAKVSIALAKGRRLWDKRRALRERDETREAAREVSAKRIGRNFGILSGR
jgi:SsrA-binding protein